MMIQPGVLAVDFLGEQHAVLVLGLGDQRDSLESLEIFGLGKRQQGSIGRHGRIHDVVDVADFRDAREGNIV